MNVIEFIIKMANKANTQTEFMKSIQHNDHFGCITLEDNETRWYPELQHGIKVSMFLKDMYKSVKAMIEEDNEAVKEIIEETPVNEVIEEVANNNESIETIEINQVSEQTNVIDTKLQTRIIKALDYAGYDSEPNESNLIECFKDYVSSGIWSNLDLEEVNEMIANNEITVNQMCNALIRYCK